MKISIVISLVFIGVVCSPCFGQRAGGRDKSYELYLTQIAAAEAFYQLNKISTANHFLNSCEKKYRGLEWRFLEAALDQSINFIEEEEDVTYSCIKVSPDGKNLAVCGSDSLIRIYTYSGFTLIKVLKGHTHSVSSLDFSHNGKLLVSGGRDHTIIVWDLESEEPIYINDTSFTQGIYQVRFSPDDTMVGVVSWERVKDRAPHIFGFAKLLNLADGQEIKKIELDNHPASGIVFTPDGQNMLISTWGEVAYSYNIKTGNQNWKFDLSGPEEYNAFHSMDISPDGKRLALGSTDYRVYILDVNNGTVIHRIESWNGHTKVVKAIRFSGDGQWLATAGEDQTILVWNTRDYTKKQSLVGHVNTVSALDWSGNCQSLFSTSLDGTIREWDLTRPFEATYTICDFGPWQTPVVAGSDLFAAPCSDKKLKIYKAGTGEAVKDFGAQNGLSADLSRDGKTLVTASFDGIVRVWSVDSGREIKTFHGHTSRVDGVVYMNKNTSILSVGDSTLRVWHVGSGNALQTVHFKTMPFRIRLSTDESQAFIGCNDGSIRIVDTQTWSEIANFKAMTYLQEMEVSPDGKTLALFCGKDIELWNIQKMQLKNILKGHEKAGYGIGFSGDSRYLISGSSDQTFKLWNLKKGLCTLTFHGNEETIYSSKFLSGHEILLSSSDGKIMYYKF